MRNARLIRHMTYFTVFVKLQNSEGSSILKILKKFVFQYFPIQFKLQVNNNTSHLSGKYQVKQIRENN